MTTRARSRSSPSAGVRLRGRGDDRWTRCSELLVSSRKRSTRQPELSQAGPSDSQRGGRARAHSRQLPVALGLSVQPSGADQLHVTFGRCLFPNPIFIRTDGHKSRYGDRGSYVRGRSPGKTGPPGTTVSPWYAGGLKHINSNQIQTKTKLLITKRLKQNCSSFLINYFRQN